MAGIPPDKYKRMVEMAPQCRKEARVKASYNDTASYPFSLPESILFILIQEL
jgi:hypothetical protein